MKKVGREHRMAGCSRMRGKKRKKTQDENRTAIKKKKKVVEVLWQRNLACS